MPAKKGLKPGAASTLSSVETLDYRLAPEDELLEKKVLLASCCLWVPVLPDSSVPGEPSGVSWRRWLFDYCHATFLNPHRAAGESFQMLRRSGYWDSLTVDFNRWYSECEVCHRHRAKPVAAPLRSITGADEIRQRLPWSDVIVDVQGPYTKAEGGELYVLSYHGSQARDTSVPPGRLLFSCLGHVRATCSDHPGHRPH